MEAENLSLELPDKLHFNVRNHTTKSSKYKQGRA